MSAADLLAAIVGATRRRVDVERAALPLERLRSAPPAGPQAVSRFRDALTRADGVHIIAECKRRSPSRGVLRAGYDPAEIAVAYQRAGAAAISVLTEPAFFDGALEHLEAVRAATRLPVLRKDFTIDPYQVWQARSVGADAVLLIVAALDDSQLLTLLDECRAARLDALVEVHDEDELGRALSAGADLIGVNNRNLHTLAVNVETSHRLASAIPPGAVAVAESGLREGEDLVALMDRGYKGFLIGERFMTAEDPGAALRAMLAGAGRGVPPCA